MPVDGIGANMRLLLFLILPLVSIAQIDRNDSGNATRALEKALMRVPEVKRIVKGAEKKALTTLDIDKDHLKYFAPLIILYSDTIDTGRVLPVKVNVYQGELRPVMKYNVRSGQTDMVVRYGLDF